MPRLGIFPRLIIGYVITFALFMVVSIYEISQLHKLNTASHYILEIHNRIEDYNKKLSDSLLSQMRYERKFIILKDDTIHEQFLLSMSDFNRYLSEIKFIAETSRMKDLLLKIEDYHNQYQSFVDEEVEFMRVDQPYSQDLYREQKERAVDSIMEELRKLKAYSQEETYDKIKRLSKAGADAHKIAMAMAIIALFGGIVISFFITRSITKPLSAIVDKTREIANGVFKEDLNLFPPPEIEKVTKAFNSMCNKLKIVDKMKSDFFATMSHELRTPLTSIKEGTSLLLEGVGGEVAERQKRLLTIIDEESHRLIDLVNSLLDLSKMEAGMMVLNYANTDITPLINKAVKEIEPLALAKGIVFKVELFYKLPAIKMDRERILQVLRNLIGNAVKFTPNGGEVRITVKEIEGNLEVSVQDPGPGIPEENLATIFEKFQQVPLLGSYQMKGTGLGLTIVKHIVTAHGGKVWAESEQQLGSTFTFLLPVCSS